MVRILITFFTIGIALGLDGWETDFEQARKKAQEQQKDILTVFKCDEWNPKQFGKLERQFTCPEFSDYAREKYILLLLPKPDSVDSLDDGVQYPAVMFSNMDGIPYYCYTRQLELGPDWFPFEEKFALAAKSQLIPLLHLLEKSEGKDRFLTMKKLDKFLPLYLCNYHPEYSDLRSKVMEEDLNDISGLNKKNEELSKQIEQLQALWSEMKEKEQNEGVQYTIDDHFKPFSDVLDNINIYQGIYFSNFLANKNIEGDNISDLRKNWDREILELVSIAPGSHISQWLQFFGSDLFFWIKYGGDFCSQSIDQDPEKLNTLLLQYEKDTKLSHAYLQLLYLAQARCLIYMEQIDQGIIYLRKARDIAPWSRNAAEFDRSLKHVVANKGKIENLVKRAKKGDESSKELLKKQLEVKLDIYFALSI